MASLVPKASSEDPREFSDFVALLTEGLCTDFPMYLHRVAMTFKAFDSIHDLKVQFTMNHSFTIDNDICTW